MGVAATSPVFVPAPGSALPLYRPLNPRASSLYQLLDSSCETVKSIWEERFFARVVCPTCRSEFLVAFSGGIEFSLIGRSRRMSFAKRSASGMLAITVTALWSCAPAPAPDAPSGDWLVYGGDKANTKATQLAQIDRGNVDGLGIAWRWKSLSNDIDLASMGLLRFTYQSTPLAIDGVLYAPSKKGPCRNPPCQERRRPRRNRSPRVRRRSTSRV